MYLSCRLSRDRAGGWSPIKHSSRWGRRKAGVGEEGVPRTTGSRSRGRGARPGAGCTPEGDVAVKVHVTDADTGQRGCRSRERGGKPGTGKEKANQLRQRYRGKRNSNKPLKRRKGDSNASYTVTREDAVRKPTVLNPGGYTEENATRIKVTVRTEFHREDGVEKDAV